MTTVQSLSVQNIHDNSSECLKLINEQWDEIQYFSPSEPICKDGKLYKFRGMIQDMPNPVYYFTKYEVLNKTTGQKQLRFGKYVDTLTCGENETLNLESPACENGERRPYFMVPVPAISEWAKIKIGGDKNLQYGVSIGMDQTSANQNDSKRPVEDMEVDDEKSMKRQCVHPSEGGSSSSNKCDVSKTPGCLVMLYDVPEASVKLNEVLEVVGFVYSNPLPSSDEDEFDDSYKPPSPLTPRIHAVSMRKITNFNPLIKSIDSNSNQQIISEAESVRSDLHLALSQLFFGDTLIADYLICYLISRIYHRDDTDVILGKFSLNISHLPGNYLCKEFSNFLSKLVPKVCYLPFTIDNFNNCQLLSRKNYKTGHLEPGILQLTDNTHLIIDETKLSEGKLEDKGVRNVNALRSLIKRQKLDYDFTYYTVGFSTDIPVLTLSQTKSLLPFDMQLTVVPDKSWNSKIEESFEAVNKYLNDDLLNKIRVYLSVSANLPFTLQEEFQSIIQDDFVLLRQNDPSFSGNDLHELLVLSRFLSLSHCKTSLSKEIWDKAKAMIVERRSR